MKSPRSKRSGFTLTEVIVSSVISSLVLSLAVSVFLMCIGSWARGESQMDGDGDTRKAMRAVAHELREAMWVSVDADGMGITFRQPRKDASGAFQTPVVWDGVDRRIFLDQSELVMTAGPGTRRRLATNVTEFDAFQGRAHAMDARREVGGTTTFARYRIFTPNAGALTTEVVVQIVTGAKGGQVDEVIRSRKRERVVLRNVPELIK